MAQEQLWSRHRLARLLKREYGVPYGWLDNEIEAGRIPCLRLSKRRAACGEALPDAATEDDGDGR
jgi:hypothetical protein